jgi:hypothetical protein
MTAVVLALFALSGGQARGESISITFDQQQLVNNDPIEQFYNGGTTYRGVDPGPNLGVTFSINARVFTQTSGLTGTFTTPGIMELYSDTAREGETISATMNVLSGFTGGVAFDYAAIDQGGSISIYSGTDGQGNLLGSFNLPVTSPSTGPGIFVADAANFSGTAESVVFTGGNKQIAFDDLQLQLASAPEPTTGSLLGISAAVLWAAVCWRHRARRAGLGGA